MGMKIDDKGVVIRYKGTEPSIEIPEGVKAINLEAKECFINSEAMVLSIPSTLTKISLFVHYLPNLQTIYVHRDNPAFEVKDGCLIEKKTMRLIAGGYGAKIPEGTKKIDPYAFWGSKWVKDVVIPSSVKCFSYNAFAGCQRFSSIEVAKENKHFYAKNGYLIGKKDKILICGVGDEPLPSDIKWIAPSAFHFSYNIEEIEIPEGVNRIGGMAFSYCTNLKKVTLPSTLETLEDNAFTDCSSLTELIIPEGVKFVGKGIVNKCPSLRYLFIPSTVTEIENNYLGDVPEDTKVYVDPRNDYYISSGNNISSKVMGYA